MNSPDAAGRLLSCEHGRRCISRPESDVSAIILADRYEGKRGLADGFRLDIYGNIFTSALDGVHVYRKHVEKRMTLEEALFFVKVTHDRRRHRHCRRDP
jgi:sugar lactone lactonase YvrE